MKRRNFVKTTGLSIAACLLHTPFRALAGLQEQVTDIAFPDKVFAILDNESVQLKGNGSNWTFSNLAVKLVRKTNSLAIEVEAPAALLSEVKLQWNIPQKTSSLLLNDHWERTYGDVSWHHPKAEELFPWYFMEYNNGSTSGFGVKTGCKTFCGWTLSGGNMALVLDTRNGANGVGLGNRKLAAAEIVTIKNKAGETPFATTRRFAKMMCDKPRLPDTPVYGINDWYFSYGKNSADLIMQHTELIAPMAAGLKNRPFSVVDDGWFVVSKERNNHWADVQQPNEKFGDMKKLAAQIKTAGMRPGLWTRPLLPVEKARKELLLPAMADPGAKRQIYDPSVAENLGRVKTIFKTYKDWDYELIKFDYTSWDIFQRWGFQMLKDGKMSHSPNWSMNDRSKTNAEIILNLYRAIRESAGNMYIIACNTFSHLCAGLFEINRIGDDTSGAEWERTKKMGVNTLAFRGLTHNLFYAADGDCVGLTTKVDWTKNKQWMELLAKSGTPLFISAQPEAVGDAQKQTIKECLALASQNLPVGEPLDWLENPTPAQWKLNGSVEKFNWDG
jgi:alpha-galactosidase